MIGQRIAYRVFVAYWGFRAAAGGGVGTGVCGARRGMVLRVPVRVLGRLFAAV